MKKSKKSFLAILLVFCIMLSFIPSKSEAYKHSITYNETPAIEKYYDEEMDLFFERKIEKDKIIVKVKSHSGEVIHTAIQDNGKIYVDGDLISDNEVFMNEINKVKKFYETDSIAPYAESLSGIKWDDWSNLRTIANIPTGGKPAAVIYIIIAAAAPGIGISIIAGILGLGSSSYDMITIKDKTRIGSGNGRYYFETYTYFYADYEYKGRYFTSGSRR